MDTMSRDISGSQVTYSWRTKKRNEKDYQDYEGLTGEELRHQLYNEYAARYDTGHEFSTWKSYFTYEFNRSVRLGYYNIGQGPGDGIMYVGPLRPTSDGTTPTMPTMDAPSGHDTDLIGTKFIGMVAPTADEAAAATFLSELLKDGLPKLPAIKAFVNKLSASGLTHQTADNYLQYQFEYKPFLNDLRKIAGAVRKASKTMRQYRRDSDRVVRRRAHFAEEVNYVTHPNETSDGFIGLPRMNFQEPRADLVWSSYSPQIVTTTYKTKWSFSGAFSYHLSEATGFFGRLTSYEQQADHLLGLDFNLETLWNVTNWSWLVDWFFDVSEVLKNIDLLHSDSLVLRYGYVMCHQSAERIRVVKDMIPNSHSAFNTTGYCSTGVISSTAYFERKTRTRATPYGFGLDVGSFSDVQWAILGALGLSRGSKALRHNE